MRIIRETINADGTVAGGAGFTVNHSSTDIYTITFDTPFPSGTASTIIVTGNIHVPDITWRDVNFIQDATGTNSGFQINITEYGKSSWQDGIFDFIVIGSR